MALYFLRFMWVVYFSPLNDYYMLPYSPKKCACIASFRTTQIKWVNIFYSSNYVMRWNRFLHGLSLVLYQWLRISLTCHYFQNEFGRLMHDFFVGQYLLPFIGLNTSLFPWTFFIFYVTSGHNCCTSLSPICCNLLIRQF